MIKRGKLMVIKAALTGMIKIFV